MLSSTRSILQCSRAVKAAGNACYFARLRMMGTIRAQLSEDVKRHPTVAYSWGDGISGQLGHATFQAEGIDLIGKEYVQDRPRRILKSKHFLSFDTNAEMSLALTKDGQLYACGKSDDLLKFVFPTMKDPASREFVPILPGKKIVSASLGTHHAVVVDDKGKAYSWGSNGSWYYGGGQLGHGDREAVIEPRLIDFLDNYGAKIVQVSCGDRHTVFLTDDGEVLTCGAGEYGRLGHGGSSDALVPTPVEALEEEDIVQVSAGHDHTLALTRNGAIYAWGRNQSGQLGLSDTYMDIYSLEGYPRKVNVFQGEGDADYNVDSRKDNKGQSGPPVVFIEVHAGNARSTAVCQTGDLYMWGARLAHTPKRVPSSEFNGQKVLKAVVGGDNKSAILCLTSSHQLFALGDAASKILGHPKPSSRQIEPKRITFTNHDNAGEDRTEVLDVFGGYGNHAMAIVKAPSE